MRERTLGRGRPWRRDRLRVCVVINQTLDQLEVLFYSSETRQRRQEKTATCWIDSLDVGETSLIYMPQSARNCQFSGVMTPVEGGSLSVSLLASFLQCVKKTRQSWYVGLISSATSVERCFEQHANDGYPSRQKWVPTSSPPTSSSRTSSLHTHRAQKEDVADEHLTLLLTGYTVLVS